MIIRALVILMLALSIGANTSVFTVADSLLLQPLPYARPERLISFNSTVSYPFFTAVNERNRSFTGAAACIFESFNLTRRGDPEQVQSARISWNFFDVLGVHPAAGRTFLAEEDRPGGRQVVILSYEFAIRLFGTPEAAIGQNLTLDASDYTVAGVLPRTFEFSLFGPRRDIWSPRVFDMSFVTPARVARGGTYFNVVARLRDGISPAQARSEVAAIHGQYKQEHPGNFDATFDPGIAIESLQDQLVAGIRPTVLMLWGAVSLVLLIACANIASLLVTRALGRRKEFAIRATLGATRWRIIRQLLGESVMLALAGGGIGIVLALAGTRFLTRYLQIGAVSMDYRVLAFTLVLSLTSGMIFGLAPALQFRHSDLSAALREEGRGFSGSRAGNRSRGALVVAQVALSMMLLVAAGLLVRSFLQVRSQSTGFDPSSTLTMQINLPATKYGSNEAKVAFYRATLEHMRTLPGASAATLSTTIPIVANHLTPALFEGQPEVPLGKRPVVNFLQVSPEYLKVMRIPLLTGRMFNEHDDAQSPQVALVNSLAARSYWPNQNPVGKHIRLGSLPRPYEVVGVLGDTRNNGIAAATAPEIVLPIAQMTSPYVSLSVRTSIPPYGVAGAVRKELAAIDPDLPVTEVKSMEELLDSLSSGRRFTMLLIGAFAVSALFLAVIGLYGVMAYSVAQRTQELGIRMALGAAQGNILRMVIVRGMMLTLVGIVVGTIGSLAMTKVVSSLLYETSAHDPIAYVTGAILFSGAALLASYVPARRATRIDPAGALRAE